MKKIAILGSGISGLSAALILKDQFEVHLFESEPRLGGHAHTSKILVDSRDVSVDTGFLVYNELTYPHLTAMFKYLNVETVDSDMSLSIQVPDVGLEWAGNNLDSVFAQRKNLFKPRFYRLLFDILDFHKKAETNRDLAKANRWTVAELLANQGYSKELTEWYVLPMIAAIWSTSEKGMLDFPAETFLTFFLNHKLLQVNDRPIWRTVKNGSIQYVNKIAAQLKNIHLAESALSVTPKDSGLEVITTKGTYTFDKVIFATHAPVTQKILKTKNAEVHNLLKKFSTISNTAVLHKDKTLMPKAQKCWTSWNVKAILNDAKANNKVSLTYFLNLLQPLATTENLFLTLNPSQSEADKIKDVLFENTYDHPKFDQMAIDAQKQLNSIQGQDNIYFAGAWMRYGFHEDGILSAVNVAKLLNVTTPWKV